MPDRTIDQLFQCRHKIFRGFPFYYGMIENIENMYQLAVIFIDLVDPDTEYLSPNQIFHDPSPAWNNKPREGGESHASHRFH
jgi:hypothetical protein